MQNKQIYKISWYLMSFNNIFPLSFIKKISLRFGSFQNKPCFKILTLLFYALLYVRSVINNCNYGYIVLFFSQYNNECTLYFYAIWIQWCKSRGDGGIYPTNNSGSFPPKNWIFPLQKLFTYTEFSITNHITCEIRILLCVSISYF